MESFRILTVYKVRKLKNKARLRGPLRRRVPILTTRARPTFDISDLFHFRFLTPYPRKGYCQILLNGRTPQEPKVESVRGNIWILLHEWVDYKSFGPLLKSASIKLNWALFDSNAPLKTLASLFHPTPPPFPYKTVYPGVNLTNSIRANIHS